MSPEEQLQRMAVEVLSEQVWETLNPIQKQDVLKIVVSLCQQMIAAQEQEVGNELPING